jgi:purine-nucleoside phosphorylase
LEDRRALSYGAIPSFPTSTVVGHAGELVLGRRGALEVAVLKGRVHYYEGYQAEQVVFPLRVLRQLGVEAVIVTNAAGGINPEFRPGSLMLITDHLNLQGRSPLRGPNDERLGPRFPDLSEAYHRAWIERASACGEQLGVTLRRGVYAALLGPNYETPAEIRMLRTLGADAVGMSTVPEVIAANHMGMKVLGISCITNLAAGISAQKIDHNEVMEITARVKEQFIQLLAALLDDLAVRGMP